MPREKVGESEGRGENGKGGGGKRDLDVCNLRDCPPGKRLLGLLEEVKGATANAEVITLGRDVGHTFGL